MSKEDGRQAKDKTDLNKEQKMSARKVLIATCALAVALVVALAAATLSSSALGGTLPVDYESWNDLIYGYELPSNIAPPAVKVSIEWSDPRQPGGYDPWDPIGNAFAVAVRTAASEGAWDDNGIPNNVFPVIPAAPFDWSDPRQPGGYDPWDPIGNSFGIQ
jgi:hypothetical protein